VGYQIKNTSPITTRAIRVEIARCEKKAFEREVIIILLNYIFRVLFKINFMDFYIYKKSLSTYPCYDSIRTTSSHTMKQFYVNHVHD
jgi:hypothetical protein